MLIVQKKEFEAKGIRHEIFGVKNMELSIMEEKRKAERRKNENEVTINIVSEDTFIPVEEWSKLPETNKCEIPQEVDTFIPVGEWSNLPEINKIDANYTKEKIPYNRNKDISVSGAKIQGNILLPVDTVLNIDITLNNSQQKITAIGKVKWNKIIIEGESYEAGVEFIDTPNEEIQKLYELKQRDDAFIPIEEWSKLQEVNKKEEFSTAEQIKMTGETAEDNIIKCRYCSREIKSDAVKCEHCGRTLAERTARKIFV